MFDDNNLDNFQADSSLYCIHMRNKTQLHVPLVKYSFIQKVVTNSCVKIFNPLPASIFKHQKDK